MVRVTSQSGSDPIVERFRGHRSGNTRDLSRALEGTEAIARVVALHDGDSLTAVFDAFGDFYKIQVRLDGIDAPEMNSKTPANRRVAEMARERLLDMIADSGGGGGGGGGVRGTVESRGGNSEAFLDGDVYLVRVQCGRCDKYGRLLGRLSSAYSDALSPSFNDQLVDERLALRYSGGAKLTDAEQMRALDRDETTGERVRRDVNISRQ